MFSLQPYFFCDFEQVTCAPLHKPQWCKKITMNKNWITKKELCTTPKKWNKLVLAIGMNENTQITIQIIYKNYCACGRKILNVIRFLFNKRRCKKNAKIVHTLETEWIINDALLTLMKYFYCHQSLFWNVFIISTVFITRNQQSLAHCGYYQWKADASLFENICLITESTQILLISYWVKRFISFHLIIRWVLVLMHRDTFKYLTANKTLVDLILLWIGNKHEFDYRCLPFQKLHQFYFLFVVQILLS